MTHRRATGADRVLTVVMVMVMVLVLCDDQHPSSFI
jgi:hypothetical protein